MIKQVINILNDCSPPTIFLGVTFFQGINEAAYSIGLIFSLFYSAIKIYKEFKK